MVIAAAPGNGLDLFMSRRI